MLTSLQSHSCRVGGVALQVLCWRAVLYRGGSHRGVQLSGCLLCLHKDDGLPDFLGEGENHVQQHVDLV